MQILPLLEAEANPVGDGQNEPNVNPVLQKVTEGRSASEALSGSVGFSIPKIPNPLTAMMGFYKKIMYLIIVVIVLGVIMFILYYLKL